jgi:hypothetical protein
MKSTYILKCKLPGDLFSSPEKAEEEFKELSKQWHPDKNKDPKATEVQAKLSELYTLAKKQIKDGIWESSNKKVFSLPDKDLVVQYNIEHQFELGTMFICDTALVYVIKKEYQDLADRYCKITKSFKFTSKRMKDEIERNLPHVSMCHKLNDDSILISVDKEENVFLLKDIISYYGKVPPKHAAWIISRAYNLACYFQHTGLSHNAFTVDNYFICPESHGGLLLGGWFYTTALGEKILYAPPSIFPILPFKVRDKRIVSRLIDLESIKLMGRTMFGDRNGTRLSLDKAIPKPMVEFLRSVSGKEAVKEYDTWTEVLKESFGPRKFIEMKIESFYKKIGGK